MFSQLSPKILYPKKIRHVGIPSLKQTYYLLSAAPVLGVATFVPVPQSPRVTGPSPSEAVSHCEPNQGTLRCPCQAEEQGPSGQYDNLLK